MNIFTNLSRLAPQPGLLSMTVVKSHGSLTGLTGELCESLWTIVSSSRHRDRSITSGTQVTIAGLQTNRCLQLGQQTLLPLQKGSLTVTEKKVQLFENICHYLIVKWSSQQLHTRSPDATWVHSCGGGEPCS